MFFKAILASTTLAIGIFAGAAQSATLSGTFTVDIANYNAGGSRSAAGATLHHLLDNIDATVTYTGALDFGLSSGNSSTTTIANFFASGSGAVTGLTDAIGGLILSTPTFQNTTLFNFAAMGLGAFAGNIRHDDGIRLYDNRVLEVNHPSPTVAVNHAFDFSGGRFNLIYAAANGNPSVLHVTGDPSVLNVPVDPSPVPLPAALPLLLAGLGSLAVARRKRRAA
ncbi:VPLPA-CTERM sorting domain-containing protein [Sulfitobacter sp. SK012]|uniref:VPLPA-CTERM sorting domain-containing protein n=1 Tax=Sulfitobacter sp. SK012 TaxID=1389005 RepID=UPI000E0C30E6|nr:VPLPA-CTERM sorting domain-containing protein [Sulfitobacter sp. SK012]AXI47238.1 VPLPA-CTERM sorting domain-containing protein [Sulfitobacter sp. SK012]